MDRHYERKTDVSLPQLALVKLPFDSLGIGSLRNSQQRVIVERHTTKQHTSARSVMPNYPQISLHIDVVLARPKRPELAHRADIGAPHVFDCRERGTNNVHGNFPGIDEICSVAAVIVPLTGRILHRRLSTALL